VKDIILQQMLTFIFCSTDYPGDYGFTISFSQPIKQLHADYDQKKIIKTFCIGERKFV
jgi:hypothetical protein